MQADTLPLTSPVGAHRHDTHLFTSMYIPKKKKKKSLIIAASIEGGRGAPV